jgi:ATP-dependent DNA ligase
MTRPRDRAFAGAAGTVQLGDIARLGSKWVVQEKIDGAFARVCLNSQGRIAHVFTRSEAAFPASMTSGLIGALVGAPHAELVGELEGWTEAANRIASTNGYRRIHLFDCLHDGERSLLAAPYRERRDVLYRMQSALVDERTALPWTQEGGRARDRSSGRFARAIPTDWRLTPIVDQVPARRVDELWSRVEHTGGEGIVVVNLEAPVGRRGAKRKCKAMNTLDATVISADARLAHVAWAGGTFIVSCIGRQLEPGQVIEVACNGYYETGARLPGKSYGTGATPRFARIVRARPDLMG